MIGDRIGRVRALALTIVAYSVFTLMCGFVTNIWQLAILRILCGFGLGGEQPVGSTFVAESLPEDRRVKFAGYLHTGYYVGFLLASIANYTIGANYGWRWMFAFGGVPALFVGWIMSNVKESHRFEEMKKTKQPSIAQSFGALFTSKLTRTARSSCRSSTSCRSSGSGRDPSTCPPRSRRSRCGRCTIAADAARVAVMGRRGAGHRHRTWLPLRADSRRALRPPRRHGHLHVTADGHHRDRLRLGVLHHGSQRAADLLAIRN